MFIYKITNIVNDKVYIGQSIRPIEERFKRHINDSMNNILDTHFARAIRKYGSDSFYIELIDTALNQDELNIKEQYWIKFYNSVLNGYNETDAIYKSGGNTYQSKTEDEMSQIKDKISKTKIGALNPNSKAIKCLNIETNEEFHFNTLEECRMYFNEKNHRFITTRVTFQTKSLYKNIWKIGYENEAYHDFKTVVNKCGKKISVEDVNNNKIYYFESIRLASRELGINRNKIQCQISDNKTIFKIDNYIFTILN